MSDLFLRTEDIKNEHLDALFVETEIDRKLIDHVKSHTPVLVVGSRGVGKSFILRIAEKELREEFPTKKILPIYITFNRASLLSTSEAKQFQHWMLAKICKATSRALIKFGLMSASKNFFGNYKSTEDILDEIIQKYENSWQNIDTKIDTSSIPSIDDFKDTIEDICEELGVSRISYLFDEAIHVFQPDQQRQFFTLFRDLRSPYISCNAAVYPGVTSYGDTFQPSHDALSLSLNRDVLSVSYINDMHEIITKQAKFNDDDTLLRKISQNKMNFRALAYASSGNPRTLVKTIAQAEKINTQQTNNVIKDFYRTAIWSDHSNLSSTYSGHTGLFDWGREFIESTVLKDMNARNTENLAESRNTTFFIWIHRDAPAAVKLALNLLSYTGIITEHSTGIKGTRSEIGTRYSVNLGCLLALEVTPVSAVMPIIDHVSIKKFNEYGANHSAFQSLSQSQELLTPPNPKDILAIKLLQDTGILELPVWIIERLKEVNLKTVRDILTATDEEIRQAYYIGEVRSRMAKNAAIEAVYEYLSG